MEQAPRGRVRLHGLRDAKQKTWILGEDHWGITLRPAMPVPVLQLYRKGELLAKAGKISEAAGTWREAADQAAISGSSTLAPWILFHAAQTFAKLPKRDWMDDFYREAIQRAAGAGPAVSSELLIAWAEALQRRGQFKAAQLHYQESLNESRKTEPLALKTAFILNRLGNVSASLGDLAGAEKYYLESLALRRKEAPASLAVAGCLSNLGLLEWQRGDLIQAEEYDSAALKIVRSIAPLGSMAAALLNSLGMVSFRRGDAPGAERYYRQALRIQERLNVDGPDTLTYLNNIGQAALKQGDLSRARIYFLRVLGIRQKSGNLVAVAGSFNDLASIARQQGRLLKSEEYLRRALAIEKQNEQSGISYWLTLQDLATTVYEQGHLDEAEQYYRDAVEVARNMGPEFSGRAGSLADLASILVLKQQPEAAAQLFEEALENIERDAAHLGGTETVRSRFRSDQAVYYQNYIDLLIAQGKAEQALQVLERSRSRTLLEMLAESHVNIRNSAAPQLLEREHLLHKELDARVHRQLQMLSSGHTEAQLASINREVAEILSQYQQLEAEIRVSSPAYAALTRPRSLSTGEIQEQLLDADTILLEYSLGNKHSYVWAVTQTSVECHELPSRREIENIARQLYQLLAARNQGFKAETSSRRQTGPETDEARMAGTAAKLSRMVFGPVRGRLNRKRILIVSDGALQYIPFAALPSPEVEHEAELQALPMVTEHEVITLPSASVLAVLRKAGQRNPPAREVAILADPVFDRNDTRIKAMGLNVRGKALSVSTGPFPSGQVSGANTVERLLRSAVDTGLIPGGRLHLPRLLFTRREAEAILRSVPAGEGMAALDFNATRTLATSPELAEYRIVHFATHGLLNSRHPELSGLVFSMVDKKGKAQNGFLQLEDIYNLNLPVELVVLSACETGLGKEIHGEGLIGLTRGFMYAGASRVLASLWKVDDVATAEFMGRFYKALETEKMAPAAALRKTQLEMREQKRWRSPRYWAAFQIQGEWK
ncbi:MAG: CHAT domain-containing protein [Acidobacteriia bacterium]|nr:CHAT domain-containing protein [Terriglobia bacterium]